MAVGKGILVKQNKKKNLPRTDLTLPLQTRRMLRKEGGAPLGVPPQNRTQGARTEGSRVQACGGEGGGANRRKHTAEETAKREGGGQTGDSENTNWKTNVLHFIIVFLKKDFLLGIPTLC